MIILGGLDSLGGAVIGGLAVGVVESLVGTYQGDFAPWLGGNFALVSPYVVMLLVLLVDRTACSAPGRWSGMMTPHRAGPLRRRSGRPMLYTSYGRTWRCCSTPGRSGRCAWVIVLVALLLPFSLTDDLLQLLATGFGSRRSARSG